MRKKTLGYLLLKVLKIVKALFLPCGGHCLETILSCVEKKLELLHFYLYVYGSMFVRPEVVNRRLLASTESTLANKVNALASTAILDIAH